MKKNYIAPAMNVTEVEAVSMIAASSLKIDGETTVNTQNGGQLAKGQQGSWGNIWGNK